MSTHFESELAGLKQALLLMGSRAEQAVAKAVRAALERNDRLAHEVKQEDTALDRQEIEIDEIAIHLLAKAPLASDLRLITVAMKISRDLERVGDEATTIARQALQLNAEPPLEARLEIQRMAQIAVELLRCALDAFVRRTPDQARAVVPRDIEVDELNKGLHRELIHLMLANAGSIERCLHWMRISKSLERIADHATNIAEEVVYVYEGRDIRHVGKQTLMPTEPQ